MLLQDWIKLDLYSLYLKVYQIMSYSFDLAYIQQKLTNIIKHILFFTLKRAKEKDTNTVKEKEQAPYIKLQPIAAQYLVIQSWQVQLVCQKTARLLKSLRRYRKEISQQLCTLNFNLKAFVLLQFVKLKSERIPASTIP